MKTKTIPTGKIGLGASLALLSGGAAQAAKPAAKQSPKRPNIVLVIADDCRHYDLGCYGSPDAMCEYVDVTPTIVDIAGGKVPEGLDGHSFLPVVKGKAKDFKQEVYAIQTSRGIHAGPEYYGIRSVRNDRFAYILNLTPEAVFKCMSTHPKRNWWISWKEKASTDEFARRQVERYQHRPGEELYDIVSDPFQTRNLADDPQYAGEKAALRAKLLRWMERQGDRGQQTEMEAREHMFHKEVATAPGPKKKNPGKRRPQNSRND